MDLEAKHLAMVCTCENLSDWAGLAGRQLGGSAGRAEYVHLQAEMSTAWLALSAQVARNEHVGAPAIAAIFDLVEIFLERRYKRYATVLLAGRLREEVLANVARQHEELRAYFEAFNRTLADRCRRQDYAEQARYAGDRYLALLGPAMAALLDGDDGPGLAPSRPSPSGGSAVAGSATARRSLLKSVAFEPTPPATPPAPPAPAQQAAAFQAPSPSAAGWPPFSAGPPPYYPGGHTFAFGAPAGPFSPPSHESAALGGYVGSPPGPAFPSGAPAQGLPAQPPAQRVKPEPGRGGVVTSPGGPPRTASSPTPAPAGTAGDSRLAALLELVDS
jgi:hypothetical protein